MYSSLKLAVLLLFMGFIACTNLPHNSASTSSTDQIDVPELLDRGDKIQLGKEWEDVQNQYQKHKLALQKNKDQSESALFLTEIFIREARVTGEHGHYYPAALQMTDAVLQNQSADGDQQFRALTAKAGVLLSLHEFNQALVVAEKAALLNPHNARIQGVLVDCYVELGDYEKAVAAADMMMSIRPDIRSYSRVSYLREIHDDIKGAEEAMVLAIEAGMPGTEETAWAMQTYGELLIKQNKLHEADKVFEEILNLRPNYPFAIGAKGQIALLQGDLVKAEKITQQAMDVIPEVGFYTQMAEIYKRQDRQEEFDAIMNEVFEMLEDDVASGHNMNLEYTDIYYNLLEDSQKALSYINLEHAKRPSNKDVQAWRSKLL